MDDDSWFWPFISAVFGWVYFSCWSLSFYPQLLLNLRRKSTSGSTVDFPLLNWLGFLSYLIYTLALRYSPLIRAQYAARHRGLTPTVQVNDVFFAAHALALSLLTFSQYVLPRLWGFTTPSSPSSPPPGRPAWTTRGIFSGCVLGAATVVVLVLSEGGERRTATDPATVAQAWTWLDAVYALSYVKLLVTPVKYSTQVLANRRNRSTRGWSIGQILLDLTGGVLSVLQQSLDSLLLGDWSGITGNPAKFALGNASMAYDFVFMAQHYVLYPEAGGNRWKAAGEGDAMLGRREDEEGGGRRRTD